jgi:hypothetical protein
VLLRHASTLQDKRRDFRWVRQANNHTEACKLPDIPLKKPFLGGNCLQVGLSNSRSLPLTHSRSLPLTPAHSRSLPLTPTQAD